MPAEIKKDLPLKGRTIMVTRPEKQLGGLVNQLKMLGANTLEVPSIEICPLDNWDELDAAIESISDFDWIIVTSVNGVESFMRRLKELGAPVECLAPIKIAAIGPATARAMEQSGRKPDVVPERFISDEIPSLLGDLAGKKVLLPRADIARRDICRAIEKLGAVAVNVTVYSIKTSEKTAVVEEIRQSDKVDYITFTSGSTVEATCELLRKADKIDWMNQASLVSIGPITARKISDLGYRPGPVARTYTSDGMVEIILEEEKQKNER